MELFKRLKEMKILLIDDDEWIRDSLNIFFENSKDSKIDSDTLNLRVLLQEANDDNMKKLRRELKSSVAKMFEGRETKQRA